MDTNMNQAVETNLSTRRKMFGALVGAAIISGASARRAKAQAATPPATPAATATETRFVQRAKADIRDGKSAAGLVLASLKQGDAVVVVGRDESGWLSVQVPGKPGAVGFIFEKALVQKKPGDGTGLREAFAGRTDTTEVTAAAAAKGLEPQTIAMAKDRDWDPEVLTKLAKTRNSVSAKDLADFKALIK